MGVYKRKHPIFQIDWWLLTPVFFLVVIGLTVLFSINPAFFRNQLFVLVLSSIAFFLFSQFSFKEFKWFIKPLYIISIVLLVIVLIIGFESRGAVRWIEIFGFSLQLSEICKPFLSIVFAYFLSQHSNVRIKTYAGALLGLLPVAYLIYEQPDLGNALIYVIVAILAFVVYGIPIRWLIYSAIPLVLASPFIWQLLHEYQRLRILTFINPMEDPQGRSYNLIQAVIAVGSGMVSGKGIGEGTQSQLHFLPENHTDFMFASLAEKLGFLGTTIVIVAFLILFWRMYLIYKATDDDFAKLFTICTIFFILIHFFVNIGMNIGLVPVVGVTLPFISYGGSSLLSNFIFLGMLSSISVASRKRETLQIR